MQTSCFAFPWLAVLLTPLGSCASTIDRARMRSDLGHEPLIGAQELVDLQEVQPSLCTPLVLAVAPPRSFRSEQHAWEGERETIRGFRSWSEQERRVIESWEPELVRLGLVSDLVVMPTLSIELDGTPGTAAALRAAAARHRADAVLIVSEVEDSSNWLNPWSILDLTIVGAWFAPGHDVEIVSILEAALIDTHTGYLFASAQAEGSVRERRAWTYVNAPALKEKARQKALAGLERVILERARASTLPPCED
jgi:rhombotail lipoprotein